MKGCILSPLLGMLSREVLDATITVRESHRNQARKSPPHIVVEQFHSVNLSFSSA